MPTLSSYDGTELAYHVRGDGPPLIVLPGGPMRASAYLGDLGGLAAHRRLVLLDLRGPRAALARCAARVLVLAGELDGGPRPELARRCADVFPHAEVAVQPGAGHYPWLDDPRWFVRRVVAFVAQS
ncbi:alpha/beta fold hydrolase [Streptomyces sp. NPDC056296]|uniref:alpha/beta fold hydrolase n=1 Tax=Streptomyces sp. NPDC056296 TaxID=3345775 RepID=UPI0035D66B84